MLGNEARSGNICLGQHRPRSPSRARAREGARQQSQWAIKPGQTGSIMEISGMREQTKKEISSADLNSRPREMLRNCMVPDKGKWPEQDGSKCAKAKLE